MSHHFAQAEIDACRECFYLYAPKGQLDGASHLRFVMRSLGYAATVDETKAYFREKKGRVDFATFLTVLHCHNTKTAAPQQPAAAPYADVRRAFGAHDRANRGTIKAAELKAILTGMGEAMAAQEVDRLFAEAGVTGADTPVQYDRLCEIIATPYPDYV